MKMKPAAEPVATTSYEIIKGIMSSAAEAELGAMYINAQKAFEERIILEEMGHNQPATPIQVNNSTAEGNINKRVQPKHTKAMDMRFHWLRDRSTQKQFQFYWRPGPTNYADYWTKHHPAAHHRNMRPVFLTPFSQLLELRSKYFDFDPQRSAKHFVRYHMPVDSLLQECIRHVLCTVT